MSVDDRDALVAFAESLKTAFAKRSQRQRVPGRRDYEFDITPKKGRTAPVLNLYFGEVRVQVANFVTHKVRGDKTGIQRLDNPKGFSKALRTALSEDAFQDLLSHVIGAEMALA